MQCCPLSRLGVTTSMYAPPGSRIQLRMLLVSRFSGVLYEACDWLSTLAVCYHPRLFCTTGPFARPRCSYVRSYSRNLLSRIFSGGAWLLNRAYATALNPSAVWINELFDKTHGAVLLVRQSDTDTADYGLSGPKDASPNHKWKSDFSVSLYFI